MLSDFISFVRNIRAWHNPCSLRKSMKVVSCVLAPVAFAASYLAPLGLLPARACVVFLLPKEKRKQVCSGIRSQAVKRKLAFQTQPPLPTKATCTAGAPLSGTALALPECERETRYLAESKNEGWMKPEQGLQGAKRSILKNLAGFPYVSVWEPLLLM